MKPIIDGISEVLDKKEKKWFTDFLSTFDKKEVHWLLLSDYCIDDKAKKNDVITFSLLMYHDRLENITSYLKSVAPNDLKKVSDVTEGFLSYLNSSVIYHFSLIIPRKERMLKKMLTREIMTGVLRDFKEMIPNTITAHPHVADYYKGVLKRISGIENEMNKSNFNENLFRRMFLAGSFGATIIFFLKKNCNPKTVSWISDRDAIIQKFDGFAFDYMSFAYNMQPVKQLLSSNRFDLRFEDIPSTGENLFDELTRIPDFLAGTLASVDMENKEQYLELQRKHKNILAGAMTNSVNQANLTVSFADATFSVYNFKWVG
jgi:hypothetical protein